MNFELLDQHLIPSGVNTTKLEIFAKEHNFKLLLLFGSFVHGRTDEYSDLDLAYEFDPEFGDVPKDNWNQLGAVVNLDIKILEKLKPNIRYEISLDAICLHEYKENYWEECKKQIAKEWEEYKPIFEKEWKEKMSKEEFVPWEKIKAKLDLD